MNDLFGHPADEGGGFAPHYCPRCGHWHHADEACPPGAGPILPDVGPPEEPDPAHVPGEEPEDLDAWARDHEPPEGDAADFYTYHWWPSPN